MRSEVLAVGTSSRARGVKASRASLAADRARPERPCERAAAGLYDRLAMISAGRSDDLESDRHTARMETSVRLEGGMVSGETRLRTDRRWWIVVGAVRVLALDRPGNVIGFTGERTIRAGGPTARYTDRHLEWSMALFAESLEDLVSLEVVQYLRRRRRRVGRVRDGA